MSSRSTCPTLAEWLVRRRLAGGLQRLASGARRVHLPGRPGFQPRRRTARSDHRQQSHRQDRQHRIDGQPLAGDRGDRDRVRRTAGMWSGHRSVRATPTRDHRHRRGNRHDLPASWPCPWKSATQPADRSSVITDGSAWRAVFDTTIGVAWVVTLPRDRADRRSPAARRIPAADRAGGRRCWSSASSSSGSPPRTVATAPQRRWHYLGVFMTMLHVSSMAVWLGGLRMLFVSFSDIDREGVRTVLEHRPVCSRLHRRHRHHPGLPPGRFDRWLDQHDVRQAARSGSWSPSPLSIGVAAVARAPRHTAGCRCRTASVGAAGVGFDRVRLRRAITLESVAGGRRRRPHLAVDGRQPIAGDGFGTVLGHTDQRWLPCNDQSRPAGSAPTRCTSTCRAPTAASRRPTMSR